MGKWAGWRRIREQGAVRSLALTAGASIASIAVIVALPTAGQAPDGDSADAARFERATLGQATGSISGTVRFTGRPPDPAVLQMAADPFCLAAHQGETVTADNLVVNDNGTLRWTFVYVRDPGGARSASPGPPVELNQAACVYQPHVLGMQAGGTIRIVNSDTTLHNVHVQAANNPSFNIAQPFQGMTTERSFANPEVMVPIKCDVHPWMQAYLGVLPHAFFAVTGEDGVFDISGLPAGDHVLEAWHETLGTRTLNVTVAAGATATAGFSFGGEQ